jgi:hypothetical protein
MNTLTLVVLSQLAVPLAPAEPARGAVSVVTEQAAPKGPLHWVITTPILGGIAGATGGFLMASNALGTGDSNAGLAIGTGTVVGLAVGAGLGLLAGYFAREGSVIGKIASVALWVLGGSVVTYGVFAAGTVGAFLLLASHSSGGGGLFF